MTEERWALIEHVIDQYPDLSESELNAKLAKAGLIADCSNLTEHMQGHSKLLIDYAFNDHDKRINELVSKYQITEKLAEGGMSEIYLADRINDTYDKTVVVKFMNQHIEQHHSRERFLSEIKILANLRHPSIVPIIDAGFDDDNKPWIILEYIQGEHIDLAVKNKSFTRAQILGLFIKLCDALSYIHERQILHLDIKPANILVEEIGGINNPMILDFGISKSFLAGHHKSDDSVSQFGTRGFVAPEILQGHHPDQKSDIYAVGVLLYVLLSHQGRSDSQLVDLTHENLGLQLKSNREFGRKVGSGLFHIILQCVHIDPAHRYANMKLLSSDLTQVLNHQPIAAKQHSFTYVVSLMLKRNPLVSMLLLVTLLLGFLGIYKYTYDIKSEQKRTAQSKQATENLMGFMLSDMYDKLEEVGKIDLLMDINEVSFKYLSEENNHHDSASNRVLRARGLMHIGRVYLDQKKIKLSREAFEKSQQIIELAQAEKLETVELDKLSIRNEIYLSESHLLIGEVEAAEKALLNAYRKAKEMRHAIGKNADQSWWLVNHNLGWFYLENGSKDQVKKHANEALQVAVSNTSDDKIIQVASLHEDWMRNLSKAHRMMSWYELDFGDSAAAMARIGRALEIDEQRLLDQPEQTYALDDKRTSLNMAAFFYLEVAKWSEAKKTILEAIQIGEILNLRVPTNLVFKRALSYSYHLMGEVHSESEDYFKAADYFQLSLNISQQILEVDSDNHSAINDFVVDLIAAGKLDEELGRQSAATAKWDMAEDYIRRIVLGDNVSKYYLATYLQLLIIKKQFNKAQQVANSLKLLNYEDSALSDLLQKNGINY